MITISINGTDRSDKVHFEDFEIEYNVTKEPDFCRFSLFYTSGGYQPSKGDAVIVSEGGTTLFAGTILTIDKQTQGKVTLINILAKDYTFELDRMLVQEVYENQTLDYIVKDIIHKYCSSGIKALSCDGVNDYVSVPHSSSLNISGNFSIEYWIKTTWASGGIVVGKDAYNCYWSYLAASGYLSIAFNSSGIKELYTGIIVNDGNWHHIVGTYNGSSLKIYVDGVLSNSGAFSGAVATSGSNLFIGARNSTPNDPANLILDEIRIYSKELNAGEVTTHYNSGRGQYGSAEANLVALWHCDEGSGTTLSDSSGNSNNGTLNNGATFDWGKVSSSFTVNNVPSGFGTPPNMKFNYEYPSQCFKRLSDILGLDWYADYNKDIHFFIRGSLSAPYELNDTDQTLFIKDSLRVQDDLSQVKNSIYVRGGVERYSTAIATAEKYIADGQQRIFPLGQKYVNDAVFKVETSPSPYSVWTTLTVGKYGIDDAGSFNVLYDTNNRSLIWPDGTKPAANTAIRVYGNYYLPVIIQKTDMASISTYGELQYRIVDNSISSRAEAKQRASAELINYANNLISGTFETYKDGLDAGQFININLTNYAISGTYLIQKVVLRLVGNNTHKKQYSVSVVGKEIVDTIDILIRLLLSDVNRNISIDDDEILDKYQGYNENMTISEGAWTATVYPRVSPSFIENMSAGIIETAKPFGLNIPPLWVAGGFYPNTGYALYFDGSLQYVTIPEITLSGAFTIALWVNIDSGVTSDSFFTGHSSDTSKFGIFGSKIFVRIINAGSGDSTVNEPSTTAWHHIVLRRNSDNTVEMIVDNAAPTSLFGGVAQSGNHKINIIGGTSGGQRMKGYLDDLRIFSRALSNSEISAIYNSGNGAELVSDANLVAAYPFDENGGLVAIDASLNEKIGVIAVNPTYGAGKISTSQPVWSRKRVPLIDAGLACQ